LFSYIYIIETDTAQPVIPDQGRIADFPPENQPFSFQVFKPEGICYPAFGINSGLVLNMNMKMWEKGISGVADISQNGPWFDSLAYFNRGHYIISTPIESDRKSFPHAILEIVF